MEWGTYRKHLIKEAEIKKFKPELIKILVSYSKELFKKELPVIFDVNHFSLLVGYNTNYIMGACNNPQNFYRVFEIKKKNGGNRTISEPLPVLKKIQRWILDEILSKCKEEIYAKGYVRGKSIKDSGRFHVNKDVVLTVDIKNFFPSIDFSKVYLVFKKLGYSKKVSFFLTRLSCLNNGLPQGAPTSPTLSNLIMKRCDRRIGGFCLGRGIMYTRYADDLTFSGNFEPGLVINFIKAVLVDDGFELNETKIRALRRCQSQRVHGFVVNEKIQAQRKIRRKLRQDVYYIEKFGINHHLEKNEIYKAHYLEHLLGIADYIIFLNPYDIKIKECREKIRSLI
jgi:RNA-directed DNA polymerase